MITGTNEDGCPAVHLYRPVPDLKETHPDEAVVCCPTNIDRAQWTTKPEEVTCRCCKSKMTSEQCGAPAYLRIVILDPGMVGSRGHTPTQWATFDIEWSSR